jgi:hypothetical protein
MVADGRVDPLKAARKPRRRTHLETMDGKTPDQSRFNNQHTPLASYFT